MEKYFAKSNPAESIQEHTDALLARFDELCALYGNFFSNEEKDIIRLAAAYHDCGKVSFPFQNKIRSAIGLTPLNDPGVRDFYAAQPFQEIPHGYLSPAFLPLKEIKEKYGADWLTALINAIFYHHTRDLFPDSDILSVLEQDIRLRFENEQPLQREYLLYRIQPAGRPLKLSEWERYAVIKGVLNRLDYAASAPGKIPVEIDPSIGGKSLSDTIEEKLTAKWKLRDVQVFMKEHSDRNLVVTASTGIGKTEAAFLWANGAKTFYTLPLKISINAIYNRVVDPKEGYGYSKDCCTLLHSDALSVLMQEEENETEEKSDPFQKYERSRLFAYPVTVCTVDQLFTFVYRYFGCEHIPATLKYSKVIIDEIQAYSPEIVARLIFGLKVINDLGGRFAIITATFPPVLEHFMKQQRIPYEKPSPFFSPLTARHFPVYRKGDFDCDEISQAGRRKKVLVLCNTVKRASEVFEKLQDQAECPVHLLHSQFIMRDRALLESAILSFSNSDGCGIWVSTQIVEASLDIDFDLLYTEMCPADSLLQRMGRCSRKREYHGTEPNIFIHDTQNGRGRVYPDVKIYDSSVSCLLPYCNRIFTEQKKIQYVNTVYSLENLRDSDYFTKIRDELRRLDSLPPAYLTKDDAIRQFRNIISKTVIPDRIYQGLMNSGKLGQLLTEIHNKQLPLRERIEAKNELRSYTVAINPNYRKIQTDIQPIDTKLDIYRIPAEYEFDESTLSGRGLMDRELDTFL